MSLDFQPAEGRARGTAQKMAAFVDALGEGVETASWLLEQSGAPRGDHEILGAMAMAMAIADPVVSVELSNSGPGGSESHQLVAGARGVLVRWSTARPDLAEVAPTAFATLPGLMTRLVRFVPGAAPEEGRVPIAVTSAAVAALAAEDVEERRGGWQFIGPLIGAAEDGPLQLVRCRSSWIATDGSAVEDLAAYIRAGDDYFLVAGDDATLELVPVPSISAWEAMLHTLPGQDEVRTPGA